MTTTVMMNHRCMNTTAEQAASFTSGIRLIKLAGLIIVPAVILGLC